jgi:hypothetical protein
MVTMTVPVDGRRQWSIADVAVAHGVAGVPLNSFEQVGPDRFVVANSWPAPTPGFGGATVASTVEAKGASPPASTPEARAIWPSLP